jgi:hypothetical protein
MNVEPDERVLECFDGEGADADGDFVNVLGPASEKECLGDCLIGEEGRRVGDPGERLGEGGRRDTSGAGAENVGVTNGETGAGRNGGTVSSASGLG